MTGNLKLPADKSISHRSVMIAALVDGPVQIENYSGSADCGSTLDCLRRLGVEIERQRDTLIIGGRREPRFLRPSIELDCGNSGTTMRLLAGILAGQPFDARLSGDASLMRRPMGRIADPLVRMGAEVTTTDGHAPIFIRGRSPLAPIEYRLPVGSAQIKSAVLFAGLFSEGMTTVIEPVPTRDHTERMLEWCGVEVGSEDTPEGRRITIAGGQAVVANSIIVPADISAAAFFLIAAACIPGSDLTMENVGVNSTRAGMIEILRGLGVEIEISDQMDVCNEPVGTLRVRGGLKPGGSSGPALIRGSLISNVIDEIPVLAVLGTQLPNGLEIRDAEELRHKESDRITSVVLNLRAMGAEVEEFIDGFYVAPSTLRGAAVDSFGDHRIAMACAIAGLLADGETEIADAACSEISFPGFFETLQRVVR